MIKRFNEYIKENDGGGVAMATLGNTGGMGAVVAPQPSSSPGDVAGSTKGSGDLPAYDMGKKFDFPFKSKKKSKKKKGKKTKQSKLGEDFRNMYVTKFTEWSYYPEKKNENYEEGWEDNEDSLIDKILNTVELEGFMLKCKDEFMQMVKDDLDKLDYDCLVKIYDAVKKAMLGEEFTKDECVTKYIDSATRAYNHCKDTYNPPVGLNVAW